jgi:uncharacterized membrane protein YhaH (DUF805 family)
MGFGQAISSAFANYFNFKSRASRSEYWYYALFLLIAGLATLLIDFAIFGPRDIGPVNAIFTLATIFPSLAVSVRRLHDIGRRLVPAACHHSTDRPHHIDLLGVPAERPAAEPIWLAARLILAERARWLAAKPDSAPPVGGR